MKEIKKRKITVKGEKVIKAFCEGMNQSDAYRQGYSTSRMKPETIHNKAYQFFKKEEVKARIDEIRKKAEEDTQITYNSFVIRMEKALRMAMGEIPVKRVDKAMGTITGCVEVCETDLKAFVMIGKELCTLMKWYPKEEQEEKEKGVVKAIEKLEDTIGKRFDK